VSNSSLQVSKLELLDWNNVAVQRYDYLYGQPNMSTGTVDTSKNNGQLARVEGFIGAAKKFQTCYEYDALGRLSRAAEQRGDNGARWQAGAEPCKQSAKHTRAAYDPFNPAARGCCRRLRAKN
jgi:hypothetical protein